MAIARHYEMHAGEVGADGLRAILVTLGDAVKAIPGCLGVELLQDRDAPDRFLFIEKWESVEAHKAGGALLSQDLMKQLMGALADRPKGAYLDYLDV